MNENKRDLMPEVEARRESLSLVERSRIALLGTVDKSGQPHIKAMFVAKSRGMSEVFFSTNTSSERVGHILANKKTCVYFVDMEAIMGLMLIGETEATRDEESRRMIWEEGDERYYPKGIDDPDFTVLHFRAHEGNFYHKLRICSFAVGMKGEGG